MIRFVSIGPDFHRVRKAVTKKKVTATYGRVSALSKQFGRSVQVSLVHGIKTWRNNISDNAIFNAWAHKKYGKLLNEIEWDNLPEQIVPSFQTGIGDTLSSAAKFSIVALPAPIQSGLRWDTSNPHVHDFLNTRSAELVKYISNDTRTVIQNAVKNTYDNAWTPRDVAQSIKGSIGLLPQHAQAVENYKKGLMKSGKMKPQRIVELSNKYADRLLNYRAMSIGRTETRLAANYGQLSVWQTAKDQGLVDHRARKVWIVDGAPCDICEPMDGVEAELDEMWDLNNGDSVLIPSEAHPNCFPSGQMVKTSRGEIAIEKINIGDFVLTHKMRWKKVINTLSRDYSGELIILNNNIRSTPDHPHLLNNLWVAASDVRNGDYGVKINSILEEIANEPSFSGKVFKFFSVLNSFFYGAMPTSQVQFDCQHAFRNGNVNIVLIDGGKRFNINTLFGKFFNKCNFIYGKLLISFNRICLLNKLSFSSLFPSDSTICIFCDKLSFAIRSIFVPEQLLFGHRPYVNSAITESSSDNFSVNIKKISNRFYRPSFIVKFYNLIVWCFYSLRHITSLAIIKSNVIVDIKQEHFIGKVYNITVEDDHSFICQNIVTHNCYCGMELDFGKGSSREEEGD